MGLRIILLFVWFAILVCGGGFVIVVHGDGDCVVVVVFRGRLRWNGK